MKNFRSFLFLALAASLAGCNGEDNCKPSAADISGTWVIFESNGVTLMENERYVNIFDHRSGLDIYAGREQIDDTQSQWVEEPAGTFKVVNGVLYEEWYNYDGSFGAQVSDISLKDDIMTVRVADSDEWYRCRRVDESMKARMAGIWEGRSTDKPNPLWFCWSFKSNNSYDFWCEDQGSYAFIPTNNGKYYVYGDMVVCTYTEELGGGDGTQTIPGEHCECWTMSIAGNTMTWTATRDYGVASYEMTKRTVLPTAPPQ